MNPKFRGNFNTYDIRWRMRRGRGWGRGDRPVLACRFQLLFHVVLLCSFCCFELLSLFFILFCFVLLFVSCCFALFLFLFHVVLNCCYCSFVWFYFVVIVVSCCFAFLLFCLVSFLVNFAILLQMMILLLLFL